MLKSSLCWIYWGYYDQDIEFPKDIFGAGIEEEIFDRLDEGVRLLRTINEGVNKLNKKHE